MWPFQRKTEAPAESGSRPAPAPVIRRDWTGLPPIQRLIGEHPLTAPSDRFSDDLATHHDPSVSTEPMGHQVSAEAPAGIVLALARPTTRNDGPAMISRPRVQRRVQSAITESGEWDGDEAASPAMRPSPLPAGRPVSSFRELPAVAPVPVAERLTSLSPDVEPVPIESTPRRSRSESRSDVPAASHAAAPEGPVAPPRRTLGQARRLGLGPPINRVPDRAVQRATTDPTEMPLAPSSASRPPAAIAEAERPSAEPSEALPLEASRTTRIELPLAPPESRQTLNPDPPPPTASEISVDAPVQRPIDISAEPPIQRKMEVSNDAPAHGGTDTLANLPMQRGREISAESMPLRPAVQRIRYADPSPAGEGDSSVGQAPDLEVVQGTPAPDPPPQGKSLRVPTLPSPVRGGGGLSASPARGEGVALAPLVGARPLRPTTIQRSTEPGRVELREPGARSLGSEATDVWADRTVRRSAYAEPLGPEPLAPGDDNRWPSSNGSFASAPTRSLLSPELTNLPRQPWYGPSLPDRAVAVGRRFQVQTQSEPSPGRAAELPLAPVQRAVAEASPEPSERGGESTSEGVQRSWFDSLSSEVSGSSSRAPSTAEAGSAVSTAGSSFGSMMGGHKAADTDMDELAGKLYDKIRSRLKSELLVDRERAGFLTDLR